VRDVLTLFRHASEKLTVRQAHNWTERIADNMHPAAKDALRLCYYMRSQGFDTYADVRDDSIELYLSKQVISAVQIVSEVYTYLVHRHQRKVAARPRCIGSRITRRTPSSIRYPKHISHPFRCDTTISYPR